MAQSDSRNHGGQSAATNSGDGSYSVCFLLSTYLQLTYNPLPRRKMHGFRPCDAVSVSQRWGPNIRIIFSILRDPRNEEVYWDHAAWRIYRDSQRMVASDLNKPVDGMFGTSLTWLQNFLIIQSPFTSTSNLTSGARPSFEWTSKKRERNKDRSNRTLTLRRTGREGKHFIYRREERFVYKKKWKRMQCLRFDEQTFFVQNGNKLD